MSRPRKTVREVMSAPARIGLPDETVGAVKARMRESHMHALPIVDDGRLVGIVTTSDLIAEHTADEPVSNAMTPDVITVRDDAPVSEAAWVLRENYIHHLVVVDGAGGVVGMISAFNLLSLLEG